MTKETKQDMVIRVMEAHKGKPMAEVCDAIVAEAVTAGFSGKPIDFARAKAYYAQVLRMGLTDAGKVEKTERKAREPKTAKPKAEKKQKLVKVPVPKVAGEKRKITDKTVEEIEDIKNKNLARLKEIGQKWKKGQYAEGKAGGFSAEEEEAARQYVADVTNDLDSFKAPEYLTADEVKALV
jgi:hypothetical protein